MSPTSGLGTFHVLGDTDKGFRWYRRNSQPFINLEARFDNASIGLDVLTSNTYLMLVSSEPWVGESRHDLERTADRSLRGLIQLCARDLPTMIQSRAC